MKRSLFSILAIACVLGLLTLFLGLQYKWLSAAGEAERDRMQKRVEADTKRFAEDFNREMQAAYYNFQTDAHMWKTSDWKEFNERYDFWKERTSHPELIRDIIFFEKGTDAKPMRYDAANRSFASTGTTPELETLRARFTDDDNFKPVYKDANAMVLPIYADRGHIEHVVIKRTDGEIGPMMKTPEKFGWLVVLLDPSVIKEKILPELATKYFPEGDYKLSVRDKDEQVVFATHDLTTGSDATAPMFDMSADNLMFFANREALLRTGPGQGKGGVVIDQRVESHTFSRMEKKMLDTRESEPGETGTFKLELKRPREAGKPRTAIFTTATENRGDLWALNVQHTAGSIDAFVQSERNKSFLIGLGIYLLLVGGIAAILVSAMRSKRFAQRQIDFVSSVSHEFRTPLAVIYSAGENLADGITKDDGQVSRYGELIKGEGKKLSGMVEQILEFAGASSGRRKYSFSPADVSDIVRDAMHECQALIESNGFTVESDVQEGLPIISADKAALSSAIQNLIANSVKYSNGSKWMKISATNGGGSVKISVEDKGIGIPSDELRRIFEPFYRAKEVVDAQISGNGLGLNLVKKVAEAHGGNVSAASKPGKGSTFTIEVPRS